MQEKSTAYWMGYEASVLDPTGTNLYNENFPEYEDWKKVSLMVGAI